MSKLLRVLIVEDSEDDTDLLVIELERGGYQIIYQRVETKEEMQAALEVQEQWDIILADYFLPRFSANEALDLLKENNLDLPFIIVSGKIGEDTAVAAMKAGAHDYFIKGKLTRLIAAVERELREALLRQEHRHAQEKLKYLAYYDELTHLPNQRLFIHHLAQQIKNNQLFAVLLIKLERFSKIKYSLGHAFSDKLLIAAIKRIEVCLQPQDFLARVGTDEFAILHIFEKQVRNFSANNLSLEQQAQHQAKIIHNQLIEPFQVDKTIAFSGISIGIALNSLSYEQPEQFLQAADTAMNQAKPDFVNYAVVFDKKIHQNVVKRLQLENDLQQAITNNELHLNYQAIVNLKTEQINCLEVLVRWKHPFLGLVSPGKFIPLSEETGLIIPLGQWVLTEACQQLSLWQKQFSHSLPLAISVNVSGIQLSHPELISHIDRLLQNFSLTGKHLKLEITESVLMENPSAVTKVLEQLKQRDIQLCIDDFGTGYSSLNYLRYLPIDTVKIDRCFVSQEGNDKNYDILKAIINLAHSLELNVIAEGIETEAQLQMLRNLGCEYGQGFLLAHPLNSQNVRNLIEEQFGCWYSA
ncbi:response regulator receiver modulated diguanylate cyclase/phosphodiesterase [Stanieria cyanosphaera PCC 7437]|uniref:Response regulator receiver modulated diguanylate cyclase/phosphodiesterase n=1 Tax=Stanieria cyanosphaera (strain ATCC 29371 / PCC 7437) TaxID=111780 RepID=K9XRA2_STAC7|nr:REC domain-containing phosphodiesterase [Stanieria cyanosphaera]AFZ34609.1 response regulator receiver modulated diguanylate cyclase/phosphodiesterase [Stanieria cyanosphaera PCC 7437]